MSAGFPWGRSEGLRLGSMIPRLGVKLGIYLTFGLGVGSNSRLTRTHGIRLGGVVLSCACALDHGSDEVCYGHPHVAILYIILCASIYPNLLSPHTCGCAFFLTEGQVWIHNIPRIEHASQRQRSWRCLVWLFRSPVSLATDKDICPYHFTSV